jgi:tetratricopeptide (TPR) repeat protein
VLEELLSGPFDKQPILLIIDDLEQILEEPLPEQHRTPVKKVFRAALTAVLQAFNAVDTESRLLLTSRFNFILPDKRGRDLADLLVPVQLPSIADRERVKLWQAAKRTTADEWEADLDEEREAAREALVTQIMAAAGGNPGLQEILCRPVLTGELKAAGDALAAVNHWKASGKIPTEESASQEFFQRVSFEIYQKALTETQATFLRTSTLFTENLPVPRPAVIALGNAAGIGDPQAALNRLIALGLVDHYGGNHLAANPLALTLVEKELSDTEQALLAADVISPLAKAWSDAEGVFPYDVRGVEAARLALLGNAPATVLEKASLAAGAFLFRQAHDADGALKIMTSALEHFDAENHPPDPYFFILAAQCAERIGETQQQRRLLTKGLKLQSDDKIAMAQVAVEHATATQSDDPVKALETLKKVAELFEQAQAVREKAVTMGQIADILTGRGETDEALRIHIEERLPIAEAMKDLDSIAHTRFSCAQIRLERGGMEQGEIQTIYDELVESFEINFKLQRVDGIAHSGMMLGQLLIMCGQSEDARILLKHSATAFEILQNPQQAQKIRNLLKQIEDVPYED